MYKCKLFVFYILKTKNVFVGKTNLTRSEQFICFFPCFINLTKWLYHIRKDFISILNVFQSTKTNIFFKN